MGTLYIVPTPVGNMEDMTFRAVRILKEVDLILAEDTRTSGILLKHYEIKNSLLSHHKFNEHGTSASVVSRLLAGENVALISDAGTPGISDPGFFLVREAVRAGVEVQCLRTPDKAGVAERRGAHDDLLRVALSSGEDVAAVCRGLRPRSPGERLPRDLQDPRGERQGKSRRGDSPFQGEGTQG